MIRVHSALSEIPRAAWMELLGDHHDPFIGWDWLNALEQTGCVGPEKGWIPQHLGIYEEGRLVAACPAYVKLHSMGEFVYDWSWAHAARQMGIDYYPKLVVGVPFTPVTGPRLLGDRPELLVGALQQLGRRLGCAGVHVLFDGAEESSRLAALGGPTRLQFQFHWLNQGFADFEAFLASLRSKRRTEIRRERRRLRDAGIRIRVLEGSEVSAADLAAVERCYRDTCWKFGGRTYLNPALWEAMAEVLGPALHVVQALEGDRVVAATLNVRSRRRLYGRYWGCLQERRFLHFEVCYYSTVEYCIERGLEAFEPGHGGGHKYVRGFTPTLCRSNHWIADPGFRAAIDDFLERERAAVRERVEELSR